MAAVGGFALDTADPCPNTNGAGVADPEAFASPLADVAPKVNVSELEGVGTTFEFAWAPNWKGTEGSDPFILLSLDATEEPKPASELATTVDAPSRGTGEGAPKEKPCDVPVDTVGPLLCPDGFSLDRFFLRRLSSSVGSAGAKTFGFHLLLVADGLDTVSSSREDAFGMAGDG